MRIGIHANPNKPNAVELARQAITLIGDRAAVVLSPETANAIGGKAGSSASVDRMDADALIGIGGDGTFLTLLDQTAIPLLPVNAGTVGFLAEVDGGHPAGFAGAIERLLGGLYAVEDRMKLASHLEGKRLPDATNELVVHTSQVAKMRLFEIAIDGHRAGRLRADGVILATPTGSTSYSLSALGPIVDPGVEAIVIASLAPFQSTHRAVVVDPLRTVSVTLALPEKDGVVVIDGRHEVRLPAGATVTAYRSARRASFIRFGSHYFQRLSGKRILPWSENAGNDDGGGSADLPGPA